jgi:hypothetical protein
MFKITPLRAIRRYCITCCANSLSEVRKCKSDKCWLYPYRMGKNPDRKGVGNLENLTVPSQEVSGQPLAQLHE